MRFALLGGGARQSSMRRGERQVTLGRQTFQFVWNMVSPKIDEQSATVERRPVKDAVAKRAVESNERVAAREHDGGGVRLRRKSFTNTGVERLLGDDGWRESGAGGAVVGIGEVENRGERGLQHGTIVCKE